MLAHGCGAADARLTGSARSGLQVAGRDAGTGAPTEHRNSRKKGRQQLNARRTPRTTPMRSPSSSRAFWPALTPLALLLVLSRQTPNEISRDRRGNRLDPTSLENESPP